MHQQHLDPVGAPQLQGPAGDPAERVGAEHAPGTAHPRTPTTLWNRAEEAPCPTRLTCPGCPFPQFGVPHTTQSSAPPIASHDPRTPG